MTEAAGAAAPAYSKDYWDIVGEQLARRRSVRIAAVVLVLLYAVAIYAPFLAGDRPLYLAGTDSKGYGRAQRLLPNVVRDLRGLVAQGPEGFKPSEALPDWDSALRLQREAVTQRVATMREQLPPSERAPLDELEASVARAVADARDRREQALREADEAVALATRVRETLAPAETGVAPEPGKTVALVPFTRWPALEAISRVELYVMLLWALVLAFPLWDRAVNRWWLRDDREAIRRARRRKALAVLLLPALPALFWSAGSSASLLEDPATWATGSEEPFATSPYKEGLTHGGVLATRVVMPPIPFGLAEITDSEYLRPPTWHWTAPINEQGYYEQGPRASSLQDIKDFTVAAKPVEPRAGEPERNAPLRHALGTDSLGRDLLARLVWGGRVSLSVGLLSTVFLVVIGIIVGALAGYFGGWVDTLISRIIEVFQCFPPFFLILIVVAFIGPSITNIMIVLGLTRWPGVARLVRGEFLRLRDQDFVVASVALGVPERRTMFRHILPNAMGPVLVAATFSVASGILTESALSFLGFGVQLPIPSWGSLLIESRSPDHWWIQIFPGLMIFLTVVLYNVLGDGATDALDPRLKGA